MKSGKYLLVSLFLMISCERDQTVTHEVFDLNRELQFVQKRIIEPAQSRMAGLDLSELRRLKSLDNPTGLERDELVVQVRLLFTDQELMWLRETVSRIVRKHPEIEGMNADQIKAFLSAESPRMKGGVVEMTSCEAVAAQVALEIVAIEAAWMTGMIGCIGTTVGYGLCAGLVTTAKYALIASIMIDLAVCEQ